MARKCLLDSGFLVGNHHAGILQGPYSPTMCTGNIYKFGILEYKSRHVKMYFVKSSSEVSKCIDDYCRNELALLRSRSPELARRTILFTVDNRNTEQFTDEEIMARHGAIYYNWPMNTNIEQSEMVRSVWGPMDALTRAILVDGDLTDEYWEEASRYATFI